MDDDEQTVPGPYNQHTTDEIVRLRSETLARMERARQTEDFDALQRDVIVEFELRNALAWRGEL